MLEKAAVAQRSLAGFTQQQADALVEACAEAAAQNAEPLARLAVEETTYGIVADKVEKNRFASRDVHAAIKPLKTVGIIREDAANRILEVAVPVGVVAAIIPCTNPTSTAIYKALIALKSRNAIVMSPHPSAVRCICESARLMAQAAEAAGAPKGSICCLSHPTMEATQELMRHRITALILATGGAGLVRAAYSSGKPALGVGPGNVPAYVHSSAHLGKAAADILTGKCFDNGTICSSEQHIVVDAAVAAQMRAEVERRGGFFLDPAQAERVARVLILSNFRVNSKMVGQSALKIASEAGISVPAQTRALIAPLEGIGRQYPLSAEKLSPVLSFYVVRDSNEGVDVCRRLLEFGGLGHTMAIHAQDDGVVRQFALAMPASRMVVNTPAPHGSIGHSTRLMASMSLGCGTLGGNITTDNLSPLNLINVKRLAYEVRPVNTADGMAISVPAPALAAPRQPAAAAHAECKVTPAAAAPAAATPPSVPAPPQAGVARSAAGQAIQVDRETVSRLVGRFLAERAGRSAAAGSGESAGAACGCAIDEKPPAAKIAPEAQAAGTPATPKPVAFVCEDDVRAAIKSGAKIALSRRTIVTPSARDLAGPHQVFVQTD